MTRARDIADQQDNLGGAVAPWVAGKNAVINGGFDIWQRGTSLSGATNNTYTADRWTCGRGGAATTVSRQSVGDTTNLPNIQYCARIQRDSGNTSTNGVSFVQSIETANSIHFAGKTVTLSFYARAGANFSGASNILYVQCDQGTGTDQSIWLPYTNYNRVLNNGVATLTTTWQRFSFTFTLASTTTEFGPFFQYTPTGTAGANDYFEITGVQLEQGIVATPFSRAGGSIGGELALCQRYYYQYNSSNTMIGNGIGSSTTVAGRIIITPPVPFRTSPTAITSGTQYLFDGVSTPTVSSYGAAYWANNSYNIDANSTGLTQYRPYQLWNYTGLFALSAEL